MGNKRKVVIVRKEDCKRERAKDKTENKGEEKDCKREKAKDEIEDKGAALVEQEPSEETWNSLNISEISACS